MYFVSRTSTNKTLEVPRLFQRLRVYEIVSNTFANKTLEVPEIVSKTSKNQKPKTYKKKRY